MQDHRVTRVRTGGRGRECGEGDGLRKSARRETERGAVRYFSAGVRLREHVVCGAGVHTGYFKCHACGGVAAYPIRGHCRHAPGLFLKGDPHKASAGAGRCAEQSHQGVGRLYHHGNAGGYQRIHMETDCFGGTLSGYEIFGDHLDLIGTFDSGGDPHERIRPSAGVERADVKVPNHCELPAGGSNVELKGQRTSVAVGGAGCPSDGRANRSRRCMRRRQGRNRHGGKGRRRQRRQQPNKKR